MARVKLPPEERRAQIVSAARRLFTTKGVAETSVSDIVKTIGIAQGTFYWYFATKEEALNAVVQEMADETCGAIAAVSRSPGLNALQKFARIWEVFFANAAREGEFFAHFHREGNEQFHGQLTQETARRLTPIFAEIIKQGLAEEIFDTLYPEEAANVVFSACLAIHDDIFFRREGSSDRRIAALWDFILKGLGCKMRVPDPTIE